jgi:hypothetical protein
MDIFIKARLTNQKHGFVNPNIFLNPITNKIALLLLLSALFACNSKPTSSANKNSPDTTQKKAITRVTPADTDFDGPATYVDYKSKAIDTLYLTSRDGALEKDKPDMNSQTVLDRDMDNPWDHSTTKPPLKFEFGHKLIVLEKINGWLGVLEGITRRTKEYVVCIKWRPI